MQNLYEKAIACIISGFTALLTRAHITQITIGQSALDYRNSQFPLVLLEWNMASSKQLPRNHISSDGCKLQASRLLEFNSRILAYSVEHPTECLLLLETLVLGKGTAIFQNALSSAMKQNNITNLAVGVIDGIEQEDIVDRDNEFFYSASARMQWTLNEPLELGAFPTLGFNRQDKTITFEKVGPIYRANLGQTTLVEYLPTTQKFEIIFTQAPAQAPARLFINTDPYSLKMTSPVKYETTAVTKAENQVTDQGLELLINGQWIDSQFFFNFDTIPDINLEAKSEKSTITRRILTRDGVR